MQKVTFKQYHKFVSSEDLSEEQLSEIFGLFGQDKEKLKKLQAQKDALKKQADEKKKAIQKAKDAQWAAAKSNVEKPTSVGSPLMQKSVSQMRAGAKRAVDRDPFGLTFEGAMDEVDAELQDLWPKLESGEVDLYDVIAHTDKQSLSKNTRAYLQHRFDDISSSHRLHPDDEMEEIIQIMMDDLEANYG